MPKKILNEKSKKIIGWQEWVSLPKLGIEKIKAKIDTGARSSALYAYDIKTYVNTHGKQKVKFKVHPLQKNSMYSVTCHATIMGNRMIKSSSGQKELRMIIKTHLSINNIKIPIEITLTNRDQMGFRLLLGRTAIKDCFLVDPKHSFLLTTNKQL